MNKEQKTAFIDELATKLTDSSVFYLADTSELTVADANELRGLCFKQGTSLTVVKNTLLRKAIEKVEGKDFGGILDTLVGPTSIMFSETGNVPGRVIREFRKKSDKPILKAAWIEEAIYIGDEHMNALADLKSKEEVIGDIVMLLQSPMKNVISALSSGKQTIAGLVKALQDKPEGATAKAEAPAEEKTEEPVAETTEATTEEPTAEAEKAPEETADAGSEAAESTEEPTAEAEESSEEPKEEE